MQTMRTAAGRLLAWIEADHADWHDVEAEVRRLGQALCTQMLVGVATALAPRYPTSTIACACGGQAQYQRTRSAQVQTILGMVAYTRPYYLCPPCHQGRSAALGWCAGSISTGRQELTAKLGGDHAFRATVAWIQRLLLIDVSPSFGQQVTEAVGQQIMEADQAELATGEQEPLPEIPPAESDVPWEVGYVSMDGAMAAIRGEGGKEGRVGTGYTTALRYTKRGLESHAVEHSYVADFLEVGPFGEVLAHENARRHLDRAKQAVVIGDGARWIGNLAQEYWPHATQIVDWYHATEYIWAAAHAICAQQEAAAKAWATARCAELWDGQVTEVIAHLQAWSGKYPAADKAETYFLNNQHRMRYPAYRAAGFQIGSGSIESACKYVLQARLKGVGMRWSRPGARALLALRARIRSGRWVETRPLLRPLSRSYQRKAA